MFEIVASLIYDDDTGRLYWANEPPEPDNEEPDDSEYDLWSEYDWPEGPDGWIDDRTGVDETFGQPFEPVDATPPF